MTNQEYADSLRKLADVLERNGDFVPVETMPTAFTVYSVHEKGDAAKIIRAIGGHWDKKPLNGSDLFEFSRGFGCVNLRIILHRGAVCRRVVKGTVSVPETVIPATPEQIIPARVTEVIEWECDEPILEAQAEGD